MKNRTSLYSARKAKPVIGPSYRNCSSVCPSSLYADLSTATAATITALRAAIEAQVLLDLPVRTDTNSGLKGDLCTHSQSSRGVTSRGVGRGVRGSDPLVPVRCDACGLPLNKCKCIEGIDY